MQQTTPATGTAWTQNELYKHLQMAIDVEFFTIPLYLTAAFSIKPSAMQTLKVTVNGEDQNKKPISAQFSVYQTVFSVAIQEMYHLMWICNVAKSVGKLIAVKPADMSTLPSVLNLPSNIVKNYKGVGNLADVIDLLVAIETPDPKYSYPADPSDPITKFNGPTTPQASYNSIGDLYHAISCGLQELFPTLHQASFDQYQKIMIKGVYPGVAKVTDINSALNAIAAICEQGEGTGVDGFIPSTYVPAAGNDTSADAYTHYERFLAIQKNISTIAPYLNPTPAQGNPSDPDQQNLSAAYGQLLAGINNSYTLPGDTLNTPGMNTVGTSLSNLWGKNLLPLWTVTAPAPTKPVLELHVCQGLNSCAGHGVNGSGTMPGDGDCATINHTCQSSNDCRSQGGCGFPGQATVNGAQNVFTPGENSCKGLGGCASPISVWQVFSDKGGALDGKYVWCEARSLFEQRMKSLNMKYGVPSATPTAARLAQSTNSGKQPLKDNTSCPAS